jgi:hypothetical protein
MGVAVRGAAFGELLHDIVEEQVVHDSSVNQTGFGEAKGSGSGRMSLPWPT